MKNTMKLAMRDEKGKVVIMALVLLVVGGLVLTPLLGLMSTGLASVQLYDKKMQEYYAADSGMELGILALPDGTVEPFQFNECDVEVMIGEEVFDGERRAAFDLAEEHRVFRIDSTASWMGGDTSTTVECYYAIAVNYTCVPDPDLPPEGWTWTDYSGSGNIYGDVYVIVEANGIVDGNIAEGANVWNEGGLSTTGNVEKWSTVNVNGDALFSGTGNIVDGATVLVFGDCEIAGNIKLSEVYVSGNLTLNGDVQLSHVYVGGNLIAGGSTNIQNSTVYVGGDLTIPGSIDGGSIVMVESDLVCATITDSCYYYYGDTLDAEVEAGATLMSYEEMMAEKAALEEALNNLECPLEVTVQIVIDPKLLAMSIS
jgi:cytoskeletal protein CcmA (bactofilin family)